MFEVSWGQGALWVMSVGAEDRVPPCRAVGAAPAWNQLQEPSGLALPPSCAAFLAAPTRPYVTVSEAGEVTPGA